MTALAQFWWGKRMFVNHNQLARDVQGHIFDVLGYDLDIVFLSGSQFSHNTQTYTPNEIVETVNGIILPAPRGAVDGHGVQTGDYQVYVIGTARQAEVGCLVRVPDMTLRVKKVEVVRHANAVTAYILTAELV